ncbi:MAG: hypothetical protein M3421_09600 [Bacteroidota bacterium]|nr:hypothetical protein [Bacteroidota bacterium]
MVRFCPVLFPVVWQQLVKVLLFVGLDSFEDILHLLKYIYAISLAGGHKGKHACCHFCRLV